MIYLPSFKLIHRPGLFRPWPLGIPGSSEKCLAVPLKGIGFPSVSLAVLYPWKAAQTVRTNDIQCLLPEVSAGSMQELIQGSQHVSTCFNMFQHVSTCFNILYHFYLYLFWIPSISFLLASRLSRACVGERNAWAQRRRIFDMATRVTRTNLCAHHLQRQWQCSITHCDWSHP